MHTDVATVSLFIGHAWRAQVLHEAWHQLSESEVVGSSTACLVSLHPVRSELIAANVGDSGFLLLRRATSQANLDERGARHGYNLPALDPM